MLKRMIINTPASNMLGGVIEYYKSIKSYLGDNVFYFEIGNYPSE